MASVKKRIWEATHVEIEPVYYSAGYKEDGMQCRPYNLSKLLYYIVKATPSEKRAVYINNVNEDENMWKDDDELLDYGNETRKSILDSVIEGASEGADIGGEIGSIFGSVGEKIGRVAGGVIGGVVGFAKSVGTGIGRIFGF